MKKLNLKIYEFDAKIKGDKEVYDRRRIKCITENEAIEIAHIMLNIGWEEVDIFEVWKGEEEILNYIKTIEL